MRVCQLLFLALTSLSLTQAQPPNVVLIMADDLGYHDLSCYGHPKIKTPVIGQLARDGVKLTSFYAGATVCTPSRMALLTGAYPTRLGWTKGVIGHIMKKGIGLNPDALTIAEIFKSNDYQTALIGKWHLGDLAPFLPHRQGFDLAYYINKSNNQTTQLWRGDELLEDPFKNPFLTEQFTNEAIRFIEANREDPFFLYLPFTAPHFPVEPHPEWKGNSNFGVYGDVVEEMDHRIGEILATLEKEKLSQNTIVIFLSDNGPEPLTKESKATPYRGKKWSALEGGTRVPCILRWPGVLPRDQVCNELIAAIDLLPTLTSACGIDLSKFSKGHPVIDGIDVWQTLLGKAGASDHPRKDLLYWHGSDGFHAIRVGDWKLFPEGKHAALESKATGPALFNLAEDITETTNVASQHPERVQQMQTLAKNRLAEIDANRMPMGEAARP